MPYQNHNQWDSLPINLTDEEIDNPFLVIQQYFTEENDLPATLKDLRQLYCSAFSETCHLSRHQVVLLYSFHECLIRLIEACSLLTVEPGKTAILVDENDLLNPGNFCKNLLPHHQTWNYIPRHLSMEEYIDPYKLLYQFFNFKTITAWKDALKDLFSAAVEDNSMLSDADDKDISFSCEYLLKFVEATHLVYVRSGQKK